MAITDPPATPARAADSTTGRPTQAKAPPGDHAGAAAASPARVTASTAPYVTRPTRWTLFLRTFVPWQLWRFVRINGKMIRIIRSSRT
jgi:hypothetical protein